MNVDTTVLSGEDIICLAHEPWHGPWKTYQQIMSLLAETNRVFYVGPPSPLRDGLRGLFKGEHRGPVLERITPTLHVYHEPRLLGRANSSRPSSRPLNWTTDRLRLAQVRRLARRLQMSAPILWVFDPMMVHAVGTFGEKLIIAHVLDNYVEFFGSEQVSARLTMARNEERLLKSAHIVFAVSESLQKHCLRHNPDTFLVRNGVNYALFQAAIAKGEMPADMVDIPRPIIGFVGAIQEIIDFPLLGALSLANPQWSLVFVGPEDLGDDRRKFQELLRRPNVHYLGCKSVQDVPAYMYFCDVCIIPYYVAKSTVPDSDSIKFYEYLASGRPIVTTDLPSVRGFTPFVRIARDHTEFIEHVRASLDEGAHWAERRRSGASGHSWERRVGIMREAVGLRLANASRKKSAPHTSPDLGRARS